MFSRALRIIKHTQVALASKRGIATSIPLGLTQNPNITIVLHSHDSNASMAGSAVGGALIAMREDYLESGSSKPYVVDFREMPDPGDFMMPNISSMELFYRDGTLRAIFHRDHSDKGP